MLRGYSFVAYNGVLLEIVKLVDYKREAVHDTAKLNYQFTRHTLVVRAILAPSSSEHQINFRYKPDTGVLQPTAFAGPAVVNPGARGEQAGIGPLEITGLESDNAIRHRLLAPRCRLVYVNGPDYVIDSPHGGMPCDVSYGPIPLFCHVERVSGMSTVSVLFGIQTDLNQTPLFDAAFAPAVLSHQYTQQVEINDKFLTTRTTKGDIRLRADMLVTSGVTPDTFREYFAQSCPANYKRDQIRVVAHPDMTRLEYVTVDVEKERPIVNGFQPTISYQLAKGNAQAPDRTIQLAQPLSRVAKLKITHTVAGGRTFSNLIEKMGAMPALPDAFQILPEIVKNPGMVIAEIIGKPGANLKTILEILLPMMGSARTPEERAIANLRVGTPTLTEKIDIEITGNPLSTRYELELLAWYILVSRSPIAVRGTDTQFRDLFYAGGSIAFTVTHDVMTNFVAMSYTYTRAAPQAYGIGAALMGDDNRVRFGPMLSGEQSLVGPEIVPGVTLHSYSANHGAIPAYNVPAVALPDNLHNPWGRTGDLMHGSDPAPVVVDALQATQGTPPASHDTATFERIPNRDALGGIMGRQPDVSIIENLNPAE